MSTTSTTTFEEFLEQNRDLITDLDPQRVRNWYERSIAEAVEYEKITSIPACPVWCEEDSGHEYDALSVADGTFDRLHSRSFGFVTLTQTEANRANSATLGEVRIWVDTPQSGSEMTGTQARQVAADLIRAAELYDEITQV